jgi:ABC-type ATPase with predicted acetyltransferase domain
MTTYTIDKRFHTEVERSPRVLEIAEAFGLGLDDKEFVVFDNFQVDVVQGDVVYINGQSGSGKSTALRELKRMMAESGLSVADIDDVVMLEKPLTDQIGFSKDEGLRLLGLAGINDAFLYVRKPSELSDGQRYRFKLAKLIESGAQVWIADEFLAVLDRVTAKVIAFALQRTAIACKATLIVATTHTDMKADLAPTVTIQKQYREKIELILTPRVAAA